MGYSLTAAEYRRIRAARAVLRRRGGGRAAKAQARATVRALTRHRRNPEGHTTHKHSMKWLGLGLLAVGAYVLLRPAPVYAGATQPNIFTGIFSPGGIFGPGGVFQSSPIECFAAPCPQSFTIADTIASWFNSPASDDTGPHTVSTNDVQAA